MMNVLFVTGAGISANAGIATYRDANGTWTNTDLEAKSHANRYGNHLEELWTKHWGPMFNTMNLASPTYAHKRIADFQSYTDAIIATQNIDKLHERAGSDNVAHLHGEMDIKCMRCKAGINMLTYAGGIPQCRDCGAHKSRPNVVLFGEMLNRRMMAGLEYFAQNQADAVVAIGTSLNVFPAAGLVMDVLGKTNVIIINKEPTPFDKFANKVYHDDADKVIDEVLDSIS